MKFAGFDAKGTYVMIRQTADVKVIFIVWFPPCNKDLNVRLETKLVVSYDTILCNGILTLPERALCDQLCL